MGVALGSSNRCSAVDPNTAMSDKLPSRSDSGPPIPDCTATRTSCSPDFSLNFKNSSRDLYRSAYHHIRSFSKKIYTLP